MTITICGCDSLLAREYSPCVLYLDPQKRCVCTEAHAEDCVAIACPPRAVPGSLVDAIASDKGQVLLERVVTTIGDDENPLAYERAVSVVEIWLDRSTAKFCAALDFLHKAWAATAVENLRVQLSHGETLADIAHGMVDEAESVAGVAVDYEDMVETLERLLEQHPETKSRGNMYESR